jgi:hypothetical protein
VGALLVRISVLKSRVCVESTRRGLLYTMATPMAVHELSKGWRLKQTDTEEWLPVARVPTNVHLDLIDNKKYAN